MNAFHRYIRLKFAEFVKEAAESGKPFPSQKEFAESLGVPVHTVSLWLRDGYKPRPKYLELLSEKLGPEVFDALDRPRPLLYDPIQKRIVREWSKLSKEQVKRLEEYFDMLLAEKKPESNRQPESSSG